MATELDTNGQANPQLSGLLVDDTGQDMHVRPFTLDITVEGVADILMHRYGVDAVKVKGEASKGSKAKKSDDHESYVYRNDSNEICLPGRYLQRAIVEAARFHQDPRSPRKMAKDLVAAAIVATPVLSPILIAGRHTPSKDWDYIDRQRAVVQRSAITRERPAFRAGWRVELSLDVLLPEYVSIAFLQRLVLDAGRFVGVADGRPTYGRFNPIRMEAREA